MVAQSHPVARAHARLVRAQSNHRSWADFYLDVVATDGNAQMLSRMAVGLAFPMFMGAVCVIRSVVLFRRNIKHDKQVRARTGALRALRARLTRLGPPPATPRQGVACPRCQGRRCGW